MSTTNEYQKFFAPAIEASRRAVGRCRNDSGQSEVKDFLRLQRVLATLRTIAKECDKDGKPTPSAIVALSVLEIDSMTLDKR